MHLANLSILIIILHWNEIISTSITFSYRTCLPNVDLILIDDFHSTTSQQLRLVTRDFHLHLFYTFNHTPATTLEFLFGQTNNSSLPKTPATLDVQFEIAIDYYHQIDTWHYINVTFDETLARILISFNGDESRTIPIVDFFPASFETNSQPRKYIVTSFVDEQQTNVTCLLPHSGFHLNSNSHLSHCSINIKTCEHRVCTSSNSAEQYCPLFKNFDCRPFTDLECGLKTIPVRCSHNHCQNRGICYVDLRRNVTQCVCPSGFVGEQCQYSIDECQSNPCPNHSHCIDLPNGYTCVCDPGWTGVDCAVDIDECQIAQPCKAARSCINLPGSYKCDCFDSFGGQNCEMTLDPCLSQPCLNDAIKCHPILERDNVVFRCSCQSGFTGHRCEININDCEGIICSKNNTQCIDGLNAFDCQCKSNFKRNWDGSCVEQNPCDSSPCHPNATCYNLNGGQYRCMCPPTYTGVRCDEDIDECTVFPTICRNGATCMNEIGSYRCYCTSGWIGSTCAKAIDYCLSQPCNRNGTCINKINGFECRCLPIYTGDVCQYDMDECLVAPCANNGTCFNYLGGFHCTCTAGFFGHQCEFPPSECQRLQQASLSLKCNDPFSCIVNDTEKLRRLNQLSTQTCTNERDRILDAYFTCMTEQPIDQCHCPLDLIPCGNHSTFVSNLQRNSICNCRNGGTCFWINSTNYRCYCPSGLTGPDCLTDIDLCASRPCWNGARCLSQLNNFACQCKTNFQGTYCQHFMDPCEKNPCLNNGTCRRQNETYTCDCSRTQHTGLHCEIYRSPCSSQPCQNRGECLNRNETFECICPFNFQGRICNETIDLCQTRTNTSLCFNRAHCQIDKHSVKCACLPGFTGLFCETNINECYTQPCSPNGECLDLINGYQCLCNAGWYGYNCDRTSETSKALIYRPTLSYTFHLRHSFINISQALSRRQSALPIRIQYEFRTTLSRTSLLSLGSRFEQELIDNRIVTKLDGKILLAFFVEHIDQWQMITVEVFHLWIDLRMGNNAMSQRFYVSTPSLIYSIENEIFFGRKMYSGCVRHIEIAYSQAYSIVLTDQFIQTNENRTLGCEKSNACERAVCRKNELCRDHWFYHTCECQRPFFGDRCDQIAPIVVFNESSLVNISLASPISNISLFFNTLQPNGTLFELITLPSPHHRFRRASKSQSKITGALLDGRFRLIVVDDDGPIRQEYELRSNHLLNDGRSHRVELDLKNHRLIIDGIYNETLTKTNNNLLPYKVEFFGDGELHGWLQDVRINDQLISLVNTNKSNKNFNVTSVNIDQLETNPCYPNNPCQNQATCLVTNAKTYVCQCEPNWFGQNCSEPNLCQYNNNSLCPQGFICTTTDENQECLAVATFEGNSSSLLATLNHNFPLAILPELSFRLRARAQYGHVLTIKNLLDTNYFSLYLSDRYLLYRDSISIENLTLRHVQLDSSLDHWSNFHFHWLSPSTMIVNHLYTYTTNLTFEQLFTSNGNIQIFLGNGFRGCLDRLLVGGNIYVPFYKDGLRLDNNDTRSTKFLVEQMENIQINNCTFMHICENIDSCNRLGHGRCERDFDRGQCVCNRGWEGDTCEINIDECIRGNNCSIEHSICEDQIDGYYTCKCQQGFIGQFCETNIDECLSSPCANGARCIDLINGYSCNCTDDYIGSNCSISIEETCFGRRHPCQNNGTCLVLTHDLYVDHPNTECRCANGFIGQWCETDLCRQLHCQNNGTCQRMPEGKAHCSCTKQWQGDECEQDIDECLMESNLCKNNGTCFNYPGGYSCQCPEYFLGKYCERKHICLEHSPCSNHGQCRPDGENFYCECPSNFTGPSCELSTCEALPCRYNGSCTPHTDRGFVCNCTGTGYEGEVCGTEIDECLSNPCFNNASCINQIGRYSCVCSKSFAGRQCENKKFLGSLRFSYHYVIWPGVAVFLLLAIILLTVLIGRIRESRRSRGTYRPALNENGQSSRVEFSMILKPPPEERLI